MSDLSALSLTEAAQLLSLAGDHQITEDMIRADIEAGAPVNPDGTVSIVHYTAWLVRGTLHGE